MPKYIIKALQGNLAGKDVVVIEPLAPSELIDTDVSVDLRFLDEDEAHWCFYKDGYEVYEMPDVEDVKRQSKQSLDVLIEHLKIVRQALDHEGPYFADPE